MRKIILLLAMILSYSAYSIPWFDNLGIGDSDIDVSSIFEIKTASLGSIPCPRMSESNRDLISTASTGLCVWNLDTNALNVYDGSAWGEVAGGGGSSSSIGTASPSVDNSLARWNGTDGASITDSNVLLDDADNLTGVELFSAEQINVNNLRLDGNVVSVQNSNGDITLTASGTGGVSVTSDLSVGTGAAADINMAFNIGGSNPSIKYNNSTGKLQCSDDGAGFTNICSQGTVVTPVLSGLTVMGCRINLSGSGAFKAPGSGQCDDWIEDASITRTGTGLVTINPKTGTCTSDPICMGTSMQPNRVVQIATASPTILNFRHESTTGSLQDNNFQVLCLCIP